MPVSLSAHSPRACRTPAAVTLVLMKQSYRIDGRGASEHKSI
jgi:hypothetical protein